MKLRADIVTVYRELHSWVGVVAGLFLFIAFYAGAISMFEPALESWLTPRVSLPAAVSLDRTPELMQKVFEAFPESRRNYTIVAAPDADHPARMVWPLTASRHGHGAQSVMMAALDEQGGLVTAQRKPSAVAQLIDTLHQQMGLPLPHEIAMIVMGFIALGYALALVSGTLVFLPALAKALFAVRLEGSVRRKWLDLHNLLGFCSLPFHIVMALTSVVFAFHDVIFTVQAEFLAQEQSDGHQGGHGGRVTGGMPHGFRPPAGAKLLGPAEIVSRLAQEAPQFTPDTLDYSTRPGGGVMLRVAGHDPSHLMRGPSSGFTTMDPYSGRLLWRDYLPGHQPRGFAALTSLFALHFGSYGGAPIRWAYLVLGFAGAFLFYTGNRLWIAVRRRKEKASGVVTDTRGTLFLSRLTVGCCSGCMTGIAVVLSAALLAPATLGEDRAWLLYHGVFWLVIIVALLVPKGEKVCLWSAILVHLGLAIVVLWEGRQPHPAGYCVALIALTLSLSLYRLAKKSQGAHSAVG
ncbi:PepSY-associated TM helix domain-containing protein [Asaia sp. BMEF1]|uniref:PepSY-associated TM helix domain-containing protein n=1 Tax=Asaia sp. BMEF1 TaxID=3155932 RepID=UPI003F660E36